MRVPAQEIARAADDAGSLYDVPTALLSSLAWQESGWNTTPARGSKWLDELGVLQIRPGTARMLGYSGPLEALTSDLALSFHLAALYLSRLRDKWGNWPMAVSAYNAGRPIQGNLDSYVRPILERAGMLARSSGRAGFFFAAGFLAYVLAARRRRS